MKKIKIIMVILVIISSILLIANYSNAATDEYVTTTVINGVTANWEYRLNDSNQIVDLKCTNPSDLKGSVTIPTTLDGKTVTSLRFDAFKSATNITEIVIPDSVKKIESNAFANCTKLTKVDLGSIEEMSYEVFKGCTSLTTITIPKTLKNGTIDEGCLSNPNITSITLEEGLTVIPSGLCANTGITSITIPSSVKKIEDYAFANCTKLTKVDLGSIEEMSYKVFSGCTSLTAITIPKTLKKGTISEGCLSNPNITNITFEEGLTVIPSALCANTGITSITIPCSVKKIEDYAFANCTKLTKVDLGSIEEMSYKVFSGCTSLTAITIPKTLKKGTISEGCLSNPNITSITLEEGLTVIPEGLCANTGITNIIIPTSVKKIELWAFLNCTKLDKITILDNVTDMSYYSDSIFRNHNDNLTIYCYKDSVAANHAIKNNIKYVYLTKEENKENTENDKEKEEYEDKVTDNKSDKEEKDTTTAPGILPNTGIGFGLVVTIISLVGLGVFTYSKYNNLKDVK